MATFDPCVQFTLVFSTAAQAEAFRTATAARLAAEDMRTAPLKMLSDVNPTESDKPSVSGFVRAGATGARDALRDWLKTNRGLGKGVISTHMCPVEGENIEPWRGCRDDPQADYQEERFS